MIGTTVSHYEIRERIGAGGMGVVYKAWDTRLDRWVALKFLPQHADDDPLARQRFVREAKAASALEHPHICTIHEIGETAEEQLFICMAYYAGPNLRQVIRSGNLTTGRALEMARQIASALSRAHQEGIVHRDLKPSNVMTTSQGDVAIVDFGLAKLAGEASITQTGATMGTTAYMSPEQIRGLELDSRTDLWSFGVILYQLVSGTYPFRGDYDEALKRSILEDEPEEPSSLNPEVAPHIDDAVGRLLQKDRSRRAASAGEISQLLTLSSASSMDSRQPTELVRPKSRGPSPVGSRRRWIAATLVAATLAALLAVWQFRDTDTSRVGGTKSVNLAVLPFENRTNEQAKDYLARGLGMAMIDELAQSPGVNVASRAEVMAPELNGLAPTAVGAQLGVDFVLTGALILSSNETVLQTTLLEVSSLAEKLSDQLPIDQDDLLLVQRTLGGRVLSALQIARSDSTDSTESLEAYDLFLRAQNRLDEVQDPTSTDSAVALLRESLRLDPNFAAAWAALSETLVNAYGTDKSPELLDEAERAAERALEIEQSLAAAHVALARVYRETARNQDAIDTLQRLVSLRPNLDGAFVELGLCHEQNGELSKAEIAYRQAIAIRPDFWQHWNSLGTLLWSVGELDGARTALREAVDRAPPGISWPLENLAGLELSVGNIESALAVYDEIPRPIVDAFLGSDIGTAYFYLGRFDEAEVYYRLAVRLRPNDHVLHRNLADLYVQQERTQEANEEYRRAYDLAQAELAEDPENGALRVRASLYLAKAGQCTEAIPLIKQLEQEVARTPGNFHRIAQSYAACGEHDSALEAIGTAIDLGRPVESIALDEDFTGLTDDPRFQQLTQQPDAG